jgi:hypothetical protein
VGWLTSWNPAFSKTWRALPEQVAAQAEAVRRTTAPAPGRAHGSRPRPRPRPRARPCRRPARLRDHGRSRTGPARSIGRYGSATAPRAGWSRPSRSTRGRSSFATAGGTCCAAPTARTPVGPTGSDRVRDVEVLDGALSPPAGLDPVAVLDGAFSPPAGLDSVAVLENISPSDGSTRSRSSSTCPPTLWRATSTASSDGWSRSATRPPAWPAVPATRCGTPSSSWRSRRRTGSCGPRDLGGRARPGAAAAGGGREPGSPTLAGLTDRVEAPGSRPSLGSLTGPRSPDPEPRRAH